MLLRERECGCEAGGAGAEEQRQQFGVVLQGARIAVEVFVRPELQAVDKDARHHWNVFPPGAGDQPQVPGVFTRPGSTAFSRATSSPMPPMCCNDMKVSSDSAAIITSACTIEVQTTAR